MYGGTGGCSGCDSSIEIYMYRGTGGCSGCGGSIEIYMYRGTGGCSGCGSCSGCGVSIEIYMLYMIYMIYIHDILRVLLFQPRYYHPSTTSPRHTKLTCFAAYRRKRLRVVFKYNPDQTQ